MKLYRYKYTYEPAHGNPRHIWTVIGRHGAIHFHVTDMGEKWEIEHGRDDRFSGVLEVHYRSPPEYMAEQAPSHEQCWLLGCPCWTDGTSLYARETLIPMWRVAPNDHDRMFQILTRDYEQRFLPQAEAA